MALIEYEHVVQALGPERYARVIVNGNNVTIQIPITYQGDGATPDVITRFTTAIETALTNTFGDYNVTTKVVPGPENIIDVPKPPGDGYAWVNDEGNRGSWPSDAAGSVAAHEAGHLMGLIDRWTVDPNSNTLIPNPGWEGNIMAGYRGTPWARDITTIIEKKW
jgi:hypothetical protein